MCAYWSRCCSLLLACLWFASCGKDTQETAAPPVEKEPETIPTELGDEALSEWLIARNRYREALPVVLRVVERRRAAAGANPLELGHALLSLGMAQDAVGEPEEALGPLSEAWDLLNDNGAPAEQIGSCADALGLACHGAGLYGDAERAYLAAIELREGDEQWVSVSRAHLGRLYLTMARYEEAEELLSTALYAATDDASRATRLRHLGTYHLAIGGYVRAEEFFKGAFAAALNRWGEDSEQVAAILGDLGLSQLRSGKTAEAEKNLKNSRSAILALRDAPANLVAVSAENLAAFYLYSGDLKLAAQLLSGSGNAVSMNNLGSAYHLEGDLDSAQATFSEAWELAQESLSEHHPLRIQIMQNRACLSADLGDAAGALQQAREASAAALELLDHLLAFGSEGQKLDFRKTSDPLSLLCSLGGEPEEIAEMILRTKGVVLDSVLGGEQPDEEMRRQIAPGASFVDYAIYQHYLGRGLWEQRYGAVVMQGGDTRWVPLGKAKRLHGLLGELRAHMDAAATESKSGAVFSIEGVLGGMYDFCIAPLGQLEGELTISPDGELNVVPFAALQHDGNFFSEMFAEVRFVPSARTISVPSLEVEGRWLHCAIGEYSGAVFPWPGSGSGMSEEMWVRLSALGDLPGVAVERKVLSDIAGFEQLPVGEQRLRESLSQVPPEMLHFSCHGFFMGGDDRPMFRSGLVLGGVRDTLGQLTDGKGVSADGDNLLFAGEIAGMNLRGTELVTLAACETGLGVSVAGEGVLGLQRGFQLAGARNILMTLWAVSDESLPGFLGACYERIKAGEPASSAVWQVQGERLRELAVERSTVQAVWLAGGVAVLGRE